MNWRVVLERVLGALLFVFVLVAAVEAQYEAVRLPDDLKFTLDAVFEASQDGSGVISSGTKDGVHYKIFHHNASGFVEGSKGQNLTVGVSKLGSTVWQLRCDRYPEADSKKCVIIRNGIAFIFNIGRSGPIPWLTTVSGHLGLRAPSLIEVDGITIYSENKMAPDAMERLGLGKKATIRIAPYVNVPEWRVISFDLYGFKEAVELCTWAAKEIQ